MKHDIQSLFSKYQENDTIPVFFSDEKNHRISFFILLLYIFFVVSIPKFDLTALLLFAAFPLFFIISCGLSVSCIARKLVKLSPFLLLMAIANPILDPSPFITIMSINLSSGMVSGTVILGKGILTVSALFAFSHCISFYSVCRVLRDLNIPEIFITQLLLVHRYSFLLSTEAFSIRKAIELRSFHEKTATLKNIAHLLGSLLLRTTDRSERIYRSMMARGLHFSQPYHKRKSLTTFEISFFLLALFLFSCIRIFF